MRAKPLPFSIDVISRHPEPWVYSECVLLISTFTYSFWGHSLTHLEGDIGTGKEQHPMRVLTQVFSTLLPLHTLLTH